MPSAITLRPTKESLMVSVMLFALVGPISGIAVAFGISEVLSVVRGTAELRDFQFFIATIPIAYLIGVPVALATGLLYVLVFLVRPKLLHGLWRRAFVAAVLGAICAWILGTLLFDATGSVMIKAGAGAGFLCGALIKFGENSEEET